MQTFDACILQLKKLTQALQTALTQEAYGLAEAILQERVALLQTWLAMPEKTHSEAVLQTLQMLERENQYLIFKLMQDKNNKLAALSNLNKLQVYAD